MSAELSLQPHDPVRPFGSGTRNACGVSGDVLLAATFRRRRVLTSMPSVRRRANTCATTRFITFARKSCTRRPNLRRRYRRTEHRRENRNVGNLEFSGISPFAWCVRLFHHGRRRSTRRVDNTHLERHTSCGSDSGAVGTDDDGRFEIRRC